MKQLLHKDNNKNGQMTIIAVIILCTVMMTITLSELFIAITEYSQGVYDNYDQQALEIAEAGIDNAIYEFDQSNVTYNGTFTLPIGNATITESYSSPNLTVTSVATYKGVRRSETAVFSITAPPAVLNKAGFAVNNMYINNSTLNGEIFTNNDLNITGSTLNGDLYAAGKGNGQKAIIDSSTINPYHGSGGNMESWDPTWLQNNTKINGNVFYHTSLHIDGSSSVTGSQTKQGNSFLPPIATPTFNFTQAQTLATQNGTYYSNPTQFTSYLASIGTVSGGVVTYNLPSGIYFVDCNGCSGIPYIYSFIDSGGNQTNITGTNVSIIVNASFIDLGGINISSPYQTGGNEYPVLATNGDMYLLSATSNDVKVTLNGLVFANGTINSYGLNPGNITTIIGGAWATNQINLYNYDVLTYDSTYIDTITGFNFPSSYVHSTKWYENP